MRRLRFWWLAPAILLLLPLASTPGHAHPQEPTPRSSYLLRTSVIGSAGSPGTSTTFQTNGTLGQPTPIGVGSAADKTLYAGFWGRIVILLPVPGALGPEVFHNALFQNFPNPFNPTTTIGYAVAAQSPVKITIFNIEGRKVKTLVDVVRQPGRYHAVWDGRDDGGILVSSGVYFYRLSAGSYQSVKKMLLLK